MHNIVGYNDQTMKTSTSVILEHAKPTASRFVQVRLVYEQLNPKEKWIALIQAFALVVLTGGLALLFESGRKFCKLALEGRRPAIKWIDWESLPEKQVRKALTKDGLNLQHASEEFRKLKQLVLIAVKQNGNALQFASKELREDPEVIASAVAQCRDANRFALVPPPIPEPVPVDTVPKGIEEPEKPKSIKKNETFPLETPPLQIKTIYTDFSEALEAVKKDGLDLRYVSDELRKNREIVLSAIKQNPDAIQFADKVLIDDLEIAFHAYQGKETTLQHLSSEIASKITKIMNFIKGTLTTDSEIESIAAEMGHIQSFYMMLVQKHPLFLKFASKSLQDNDTLVSTIQSNAEALKHASERLQKKYSKPDDVPHVEPVKDDKTSTGQVQPPEKSAPIDVRTDVKPENIKLENVKLEKEPIDKPTDKEKDKVPADVKLTSDVAPAAAAESTPPPPKTPPKADPAPRTDAPIENKPKAEKPKETPTEKPATVSPKVNRVIYSAEKETLEAVNADGMALEFASEAMRKDLKVVEAAVKQNGLALKFVDPTLKGSWDISYLAFSQNPAAIALMNHPISDHMEKLKTYLEKLRKQEKLISDEQTNLEKIMMFLPSRKDFFSYLLDLAHYLYTSFPEKMKQDEDLVLKALQKNGELLPFIPEHLMQRKHLLEAAIERHPHSVRFVPFNFQKDVPLITKAFSKDSSTIQYFADLNPFNDWIVAKVRAGADFLKHCHINTKENKAFFMKMIEAKPAAYEHAAESIKSDISYFAYSCGLPFDQLHASVKDTLTLLLTNLKNGTTKFESIDPLLKGNADFALKAIEKAKENVKYLSLFPYISEALKKNREFVKKAIEMDCRIIKDLSDFKNDKDLWMIALKKDPTLYSKPDNSGVRVRAIPDILAHDEGILMIAVTKPLSNLDAISGKDGDKIHQKNVLLQAITYSAEADDDGDAYFNGTEELQKDDEVITAALNADTAGNIIKNVPENKLTEAHCLIAIKKCPGIIHSKSPGTERCSKIEEAFKKHANNTDFLLEVLEKMDSTQLRQTFALLGRLGHNWNKSLDFMIKLVKVNKSAYTFADGSIKTNPQLTAVK